ncbi:MAG: capping complex subunit for YIEGIA [Bacillota bacterium]
MEVTVQKTILAAVTDDLCKVAGVPAFVAADDKARQKKALYLSRILQGAVHDLGDGVLIVVKH